MKKIKVEFTEHQTEILLRLLSNDEDYLTSSIYATDRKSMLKVLRKKILNALGIFYDPQKKKTAK